MKQNYNHFADLRKAGRVPDGVLYTAQSADFPLFGLSLAGVETFHTTRQEAVAHYERRGYRSCTANERFDNPVDELKFNLRPRAQKKKG